MIHSNISNNSQEESTFIRLQDTEEKIKPRIKKEAVPDLVNRLYGLKVKGLKELPSYDDLNFHVLAGDMYHNSHISAINADGYVLKILNSRQSSTPENIDAEHMMCKHVRQHGIPTQIPIPNIDGQDCSLETFPDKNDGENLKNGPYIVRLMTFVPGTIFHQTPYIAGSFFNVGKFVGKLHKALEGFHHSFYDNYTTLWSLGQTPVIRDFLKALNCETDITTVEEVIGAFEKNIVPKFGKFKRGVIHGDLSDQNILMLEQPGKDKIQQGQRVHDVNALLDFGDVTESYVVFDVAICIAHFSTDCPEERQIDVGGHILAGYFRYCTLNEDEFEALRILICARLCQTLVYGAHKLAQQPENTYALTSAKHWSLLHRLLNIPNNELYSRWKDIIKTYE